MQKLPPDFPGMSSPLTFSPRAFLGRGAQGVGEGAAKVFQRIYEKAI